MANKNFTIEAIVGNSGITFNIRNNSTTVNGIDSTIFMCNPLYTAGNIGPVKLERITNLPSGSTQTFFYNFDGWISPGILVSVCCGLQ